MKKLTVFALILFLASCNAQDSKKQDVVINVSPTEFSQLVSANKVQLIDVRTPGEFENGHLKNAEMINYMGDDFKEKSISKLDKSKPVFVYCASGGRSARAAKVYKDAGFKKVYNLLGGYRAWTAEKLETVK